MSVDFKKLNKAGLGASSFGTRKTTGTSAQATKNLTSSSAATKSSLFSFRGSTRTNWTPGQMVSRNMHKYDYQGVRASLNGVGGGRRTYTPSHISGGYSNSGMPNIKYNNSYANGMMIGQTIMAGISLLNQMGVFGENNNQNIANNPQTISNSAQLNTILNTTSNANVGTTGFASQMSASTSFTQLNELETQANAKKESLDADYQKLDPREDMNKTISEASEGLVLAGVTLDVNDLALSTLDKNNLEASLTSIDSDIAKIGNFQTNELPAAKNQISTKSGQIKGNISALEGQLSQLKANNTDGKNNAQIQELEGKIEKLKKQQEQLATAEAKIDELSTQCNNTKGDLEIKKAELKDIKNFEDNIKDKKYNLAKEQDKELKKTLEQIQKLDTQIKNASVDSNGDVYDKKDNKRNDKLNKLMSERNVLYNTMGSLIKSLSAAGGNGVNFENSKKQTYTIQNLQTAIAYKPIETETES